MSNIPYESYAAVDLGSNSFHMIVANYSEERIQIIDRLKDMIRLASGLDKKNNLTAESMERALQCLERFGQRIREIPRINVRAVGTNTLRQARNGEEFLAKAHAALGHPIEIISGLEEARLVFLGVANTTYKKNEKRLVIDIGGGSTEVIIGQGFEPECMESLYMGCVNISHQFFDDGIVNTKKMKKAILSARQELESIEAGYNKIGWDAVIGSSGTILSINEISKAKGWCDHGITDSALQNLKDALTTLENIEKFTFEGLSDTRRPVFAGGVAILCALFEAFQIKHMEVSDGALREGLLYDLIGRVHDQDIRNQTIAKLMYQYGVDSEQAQRVLNTAVNLYADVKNTWPLSKKSDLKLLRWAALTHETGLAIAHAQHHYHGAYLLSNSDLPGFSRQEQAKLAILVRSHRRKFPVAETKMPEDTETLRIRRLCILLRLAVVLNRSRSYTALPKIKINVDENSLKLRFPNSWLQEHPLTQEDLALEAAYLNAIGFTLNYA